MLHFGGFLDLRCYVRPDQITDPEYSHTTKIVTAGTDTKFLITKPQKQAI